MNRLELSVARDLLQQGRTRYLARVLRADDSKPYQQLALYSLLCEAVDHGGPRRDTLIASLILAKQEQDCERLARAAGLDPDRQKAVAAFYFEVNAKAQCRAIQKSAKQAARSATKQSNVPATQTPFRAHRRAQVI